MECKPIIAVIDSNSDTGMLAEQNGYGFYCPNNSVVAFTETVNKMLTSDIPQLGKNDY